MRIFKVLAGLGLTLALLACGGGGGNPGTPLSGAAAPTAAASAPASAASSPAQILAATPATVEVITSTNSLLSAGSEAVITTFVKNSANVGLSGKIVLFSATSGTLQLISDVTDATGAASAKLIAGSDKSNRSVTVTATVDNASGNVVLPVSGTKVSIVGTGSLQAGASAVQFTVRVVDSSGNGINKAPLTVTSSLANGLSASTLTTDATGSATFLYTPNFAGSDTVTATGLGTSASATVTVNAIDFSVLSPSSNAQIPIGTSQTINVQYKLSGTGVSGKTVDFSTTRGTLGAASVLTDGSGQASVTVSSSTAGPANLTAQISGVGSVNLPLQFVATTPASIVIQANPGGVLPNTSGSANQSTIEALVTDVNGNAVANRQVNFTVLKDLSNGTLSAGNAMTDLNGRVQVQFIPGAISTPADGVQIQAEVASTAIRATTSLTVNGNALFITVGFGNTISDLDVTAYTKTFSVYVTDANGVAVGNQLVSLSAIPVEYYKGVLEIVPLALRWTVKPTPTVCANEDAKFGSGIAGYLDGILNTGEDTNGDGRLTPGNIAVVAPGSVITDVTGRATFQIQYGKQFAPWAQVDITARAVVAGTESRRSILYTLLGSIPDFASDSTPAGVISPFGSSGTCTDVK